MNDRFQVPPNTADASNRRITWRIVLATAVVAAIVLFGFTWFAPADGKRLRVRRVDRQLLIPPNIVSQLVPAHPFDTAAERWMRTKRTDGTVVLLSEYEGSGGVYFRCRVEICPDAEQSRRAYLSEFSRLESQRRELDVEADRANYLLPLAGSHDYVLLTRGTQLVGAYYVGQIDHRVLSVELVGPKVTRHDPLTAEILEIQTRVADYEP